MRLQEKINYLKDNHFVDFLKMYNKVFDELSEKQTVFCVCGKLATGLHESCCRKFINEVNKETVKRLNNLIIK